MCIHNINCIRVIYVIYVIYVIIEYKLSSIYLNPPVTII